jgi:hypothetical protein
MSGKFWCPTVISILQMHFTGTSLNAHPFLFCSLDLTLRIRIPCHTFPLHKLVERECSGTLCIYPACQANAICCQPQIITPVDFYCSSQCEEQQGKLDLALLWKISADSHSCIDEYRNGDKNSHWENNEWRKHEWNASAFVWLKKVLQEHEFKVTMSRAQI